LLSNFLCKAVTGAQCKTKAVSAEHLSWSKSLKLERTWGEEMNLRDRAIYQLPNGRELIACVTSDRRVVLLGSASVSIRYELNSDGRLLVDGQLTAWQIDDLVDTGRVAEREMTKALVESSMAVREMPNEQSL
jgi:hypothetical protein